jgi:hypothetical protein
MLTCNKTSAHKSRFSFFSQRFVPETNAFLPWPTWSRAVWDNDTVPRNDIIMCISCILLPWKETDSVKTFWEKDMIRCFTVLLALTPKPKGRVGRRIITIRNCKVYRYFEYFVTVSCLVACFEHNSIFKWNDPFKNFNSTKPCITLSYEFRTNSLHSPLWSQKPIPSRPPPVPLCSQYEVTCMWSSLCNVIAKSFAPFFIGRNMPVSVYETSFY